MMTGTLSEGWDVYLATFREHTHQLLAWAHADVKTKIGPDLDEPSITGLLGDAMKARLDDRNTPEVYLHYCIGDQVPVSPGGQLGNKRLRLDLTVIRAGVQPRPSYILEAKRLRTGSYTIGDYIGTGGMGDFISCRYGGQSPEAAMVGLIQDKDAVYWFDELKRVFDVDATRTPQVLSIKKALSRVEVIAEITDEWESYHSRTNGTDLRLLHIFLPCAN